MALVEPNHTIQYEGPSDILAWKYPQDQITLTKTYLIVRESQKVVFFQSGQAFDVFGPGSHELTTESLPLLKRFSNWITRKEVTFQADVYFINEVTRLDYKWGTRTPITVEDPKYHVLISLGCYGQFGMRVRDARTFLTQIVGTIPEWDGNKILDYFRGVILTRTKDTIAKWAVHKDVSLASIAAYQDEISQQVEDRIREEFDKYGLELHKFFISSITVPEEELKKLQKGSFDRLEIDQLGDKYQEKRSFDVMEKAADNQGLPGTMMAGGMGSGLGTQMPGLMGQMQGIGQSAQQPVAQPAANSTGRPCPKCQATSPPGTKFCPECGTKLPQATFCTGCGTSLPEDAKFCAQCGQQVPD